VVGDGRRDPEGDHSEALRLEGRSGDTDLVFRLGRDVPFLARLRERLDKLLEWLADNRRMLLAAGVALAALVVLAQIIGGAYRPRQPPSPAAPIRPPAIVPADPAPSPAPPGLR
jgi:hypothetical protein